MNHSYRLKPLSSALLMVAVLTFTLIFTVSGQNPPKSKGVQKTIMKKLTPVMYVESVEPCLSFWVDRLGFQKGVEVPEGDKLGFVLLSKDGVEVMYQSRASLAKDIPALSKGDLRSSTVLYIEVDNIDEIMKKLEGVEVVVPKRKTFYGSTEIFVREPGGNVVGFSAHE